MARSLLPHERDRGRTTDHASGNGADYIAGEGGCNLWANAGSGRAKVALGVKRQVRGSGPYLRAGGVARMPSRRPLRKASTHAERGNSRHTYCSAGLPGGGILMSTVAARRYTPASRPRWAGAFGKNVDCRARAHREYDQTHRCAMN